MSITQNVDEIRERIAAAAHRAARDPDEITLMAVSKTFAPEHIREAYAAGLRVFGENRVQEFSGKAESLTELKDAEWHMIGHLQTNKAASAVELFTAVDSVDSLRLAEKLNSSAQQIGKQLAVLDRDQCWWRSRQERDDSRNHPSWKNCCGRRRVWIIWNSAAS